MATGPEVWTQSAGAVDVFIHGIGTGGCISGTGRYLKEKAAEAGKAVSIVGIEPSNARVHVGAPPAPHTIVGIGAGLATHFLGLPTDEHGDAIPLSEPGAIEAVDEWAHASSEEAIEYAQRACRTEGLMVGPSAGAALKVACELACRPEASGKTIVAMLASHAIRYTSHPLWAPLKAEVAQALPPDFSKEKDVATVQWRSAEYTPS